MAVLLKKNEKIENTVSKLSDKYTFTEFKEKFIELYEKEKAKQQKSQILGQKAVKREANKR